MGFKVFWKAGRSAYEVPVWTWHEWALSTGHKTVEFYCFAVQWGYVLYILTGEKAKFQLKGLRCVSILQGDILDFAWIFFRPVTTVTTPPRSAAMQCKISYRPRIYRCGCQIQKPNALCLENFLFYFVLEAIRIHLGQSSARLPFRDQTEFKQVTETMQTHSDILSTLTREKYPSIWLGRTCSTVPHRKKKVLQSVNDKMSQYQPKPIINYLHINFLFPQLDDIKRLQHYQSILLSSQAPTIPLKRGRRHYLSNCNRHHPLLFDTTASCCYY